MHCEYLSNYDHTCQIFGSTAREPFEKKAEVDNWNTPIFESLVAFQSMGEALYDTGLYPFR